MAKRAYPEDDIQRAVIGHLRQRGAPGIVFWHTPNGAKLGGKKSAKGIAIQGSRLKGLGVRAGVSDIIAVHKGKIYALELKAPDGSATKHQLEFLSDMGKAGAFTCLAAGLDRALSVLERWGLLVGKASLLDRSAA